MSLSPNTTLSHYHIVSKLGAGGMGEVYLAQDTSLDRQVALKLLPADSLAIETGCAALYRKRRRRQRSIIQTSSPFRDRPDRLDHFIATEFIDGETLRSASAQGSKLAEILDVAIQTAERARCSS